MGTLFEELKRRKVIRVAAVYAVVAWLLIQVADTVLPALQMPEWTVSFVTVLFILGFPIALILSWAYEVTPEGIKSADYAEASESATSNLDRKLIYATFGLVLLVVGFQIADRWVLQPTSNSTASVDTAEIQNSDFSKRFQIDLGGTLQMPTPNTVVDISLSPNGRQLAYIANPSDGRSPILFTRDLDQLESKEVANVPPTSNAFYSSDGTWIGFWFEGELNRISTQGGNREFLTRNMRASAGGYWDANDVIYFSSDESESSQLLSFHVSDGTLVPIEIATSDTTNSYLWPISLPGSERILYTAVPTGASAVDGRIDLYDPVTSEIKTITQNGFNARYVPTGHIVFMRGNALWAVPFDLNLYETVGEEAEVVPGIHANLVDGAAVFDFSQDGFMVYMPVTRTSEEGPMKSLLWVDRDGSEEVIMISRNFRLPTVSPDGKKVAFVGGDRLSEDIYIYDLDSDTQNRVTFELAKEERPVWSPDSDSIAYSSTVNGGSLWMQSANGSGQPRELLSNTLSQPYTFTPDGSQLIYGSNCDLYNLDLGESLTSSPLVQTSSPDMCESTAIISPDGNWIAYEVWDRVDNSKIIVRPFPDVNTRTLYIYENGGNFPNWSSSSKELFFKTGENGNISLWVSKLDDSNTFPFSDPELLISGNYLYGAISGGFDVLNDGSRFLLVRIENGDPSGEFQSHLIAVDNWFEELKRLAPSDP